MTYARSSVCGTLNTLARIPYGWDLRLVTRSRYRDRQWSTAYGYVAVVATKPDARGSHVKRIETNANQRLIAASLTVRLDSPALHEMGVLMLCVARGVEAVRTDLKLVCHHLGSPRDLRKYWDQSILRHVHTDCPDCMKERAAGTMPEEPEAWRRTGTSPAYQLSRMEVEVRGT